jgi:hypothetical protein
MENVYNFISNIGNCFTQNCFFFSSLEITGLPPTLQIGPLRCWPGGLCLSRSIGDLDVGQFIVPVPYVKQVKVCDTVASYFVLKF